MNPSVVATIIGAILRVLPEQLLKNSIASFINHVEDQIKNDGKQNWEDSVVIPLLEALKKQLGIVNGAPTVPAPIPPEEGTV